MRARPLIVLVLCSALASAKSASAAPTSGGDRARAEELAAKGDIAGARAIYERLLKSAPNSDELVRALAQTLSWSKRVEDQKDALVYYDQHLEARPEDDDARLERARVRSWVGDIKGAERDYELYLRKHPSDEIRAELGKALSWSKDKKDIERALVIYDERVRRAPKDLELRLERARARGWAGRTQGAQADFEAYLAAHQDDDDVRLELANVVLEGAAPEDAIPLYDRYLTKHPRDLLARLKRARALLWSARYAAAESALGELREVKEAQSDAEVELARLYAQTSRRLLALDLLDEVIARQPQNKDAREERDRLSIPDHVTLEPKLFVFGDKSGVLLSSLALDGSFPLARDARVLASAGGWRLANAQETLVAGRFDLGAWLRVARLVELEAAIGPRVYEHFAPGLGARAQARVQAGSVFHAEARYAYDDLYVDLYQPATIAAGLRGHALHAWGELSLPLGVQLWGRAGTRLVDPSNQGFEASASAFIKVWRPISVGYSVQWLAWRYPDPSYWSPQGYAAHLFGVRVAQDFGSFGFDAQGTIGAAAERVQGIPQTGFGPSWGLSGAATFTPSPHVKTGLTFQYGQTQRDIYQTGGGGTSIQTAQSFMLTSSSYFWITSSLSVTIHL